MRGYGHRVFPAAVCMMFETTEYGPSRGFDPARPVLRAATHCDGPLISDMSDTYLSPVL